MEKSPSRSTSGKALPVNAVSRDIPSPLIGKTQTPHPGEANRKPSREEISRCIGIWAKAYHLSDEETDGQELCIPSRTWTGRKSDNFQRFD